MAQKPGIPKGTRDFSPVEMARRNYIFDTIRNAFRLYGYAQIETPSMENLSSLMGKYGDEGDKLLFKVLNSGDFLKGITPQMIESESPAKLAAQICEKGLRYDLTVPFARYVVQHRNDIQLPFKRFQMQPVWRADRPQKGRYREFYQCDADVVGSESLLNEVELLSLLDFVYSKLGIRTLIKLNNRKILAGIAATVGEPEHLTDITVAIDKIDKIGLENVEAEMMEKGVKADSVARLRPLLQFKGTNEEKIAFLTDFLKDSEEGMKGVEELETVLGYAKEEAMSSAIEVDIALVRGLNYYTGIIIEVKALDSAIGSISGGGRYDNLTGVFGLSGLSGVGVSFGADRIYDVLLEQNLFPENLGAAPVVMMTNLGEKEGRMALKLTNELRKEGIPAILYPDMSKMRKQMTYANTIGIPFVGIIGDRELEEGKVSLKDMRSGEQTSLSIEDFAAQVKILTNGK